MSPPTDSERAVIAAAILWRQSERDQDIETSDGLIEAVDNLLIERARR